MEDDSRQPLAADEGPNLSLLVIPLLKGVVYREEKGEIWNGLLRFQARVRDYVAVLGLDLVFDEAEGYAFLRSVDADDSATELPRLIRRQPLSFPVSLLLALLRKKLAEFDAAGGETRAILSRDDIVELLRVFLPEAGNEVKLIREIDSHINKTVKLGFLRSLRGQPRMFELRRIIKAFVDAQWLAEFDIRLAEYQQLLTDSEDENG